MTEEMAGTYVKELDKRIEALKPFSNLAARTQAYVSPIPYIADFAITLYSALANGIDQKNVRIHQMQTDTFKRTRISADRSILVQFVSSVEHLLQDYCEKHKLEVKSVDSKRATTIMEQCGDRLDSKLGQWLKGKLKSRPIIGDYSHAVLKDKGVKSIFSSKWRQFLDLMTLLRNKSAHGDVRLSDSDIDKIRSMNEEFSFEKELGFNLKPGDELHIPGKFLPWSFTKLQELASEIDK